MGLAEELAYTYPRPNVVQRSMQSLASTPPGAWTLSRVLPPIDRAVERWSEGRTSLTWVSAGLPVLTLTSTGRRSGLPREASLVGVPVADGLALIGTNFGQSNTPTWALDLEADPRAKLTYRGVTVDVVARPATDEEQPHILAAADSVYGGFAKYRRRISGRTVRIFVLESSR